MRTEIFINKMISDLTMATIDFDAFCITKKKK